MEFLKNVRACCGWFGCGLEFMVETASDTHSCSIDARCGLVGDEFIAS
jgi:hypothetical protein